jgi:hypothetical protein
MVKASFLNLEFATGSDQVMAAAGPTVTTRCRRPSVPFQNDLIHLVPPQGGHFGQNVAPFACWSREKIAMATSSRYLEHSPRRWRSHQSGRVRLKMRPSRWNPDAGTVEIFRWSPSSKQPGTWEKVYWFKEGDLPRIQSCVKWAARECGVAIENMCWTELLTSSRNLLFACSCGGVKGFVIGPQTGWRYRQVEFTSEGTSIHKPRLFAAHQLAELATCVAAIRGYFRRENEVSAYG